MVLNEYKVTKKLYRQWGFENAIKGVQLVFNILWIVLSIFVLLLAMLESGDFLYYIIFAFCIYNAFFRWWVVTNFQYRILAKRYNCENWTRRIYFDQDTIRIEEASISVKYIYSDIVQIKEKDNSVWLKASNKTVIRLYKDCFVESTWEDCKKLFPAELY